MNNKTWTPSALDHFCKKMVITTEILYRSTIDKDRMAHALEELGKIDPIITGRISGDEVTYPNTEPRLECNKSSFSIDTIAKKNTVGKEYQPTFKQNKVIKGLSPLFALKMTVFNDGTLLAFKASHFIMDGYTFYRILETLLKLYAEEEIKQYLTFNGSSSFPALDNSDFQASLFYPIPRNILSIMLKNKFKRPKQNRIFIKGGDVEDIRKRTGFSTTAILTAFLYKELGSKELSIVHTVNHRDRVELFDSNYGGNAASVISPIVIERGKTIEEAARIANEGLQKGLENDNTFFKNYLISTEKKLPYLPFPIDKAYSKNPSCIICNSFISFDLYKTLSIGKESPLVVFPPKLPDPVRFFPAPPKEDGYYIITQI